MKQFALVLVLAVVVLATAAGAGAGGSSVLSGHTSQPAAAQVLGKSVVKPGGKTAAGTVASGTLPFTGADLGVAAALAIALVAAGGVLRFAGQQKR